jgi:hypothetical protein
LRSISGLQPIDGGAGVIEAFGGPVQARGRISDRVREARIRIGFIFQQFNLVGRLSLFTNVALGSLGRIPAPPSIGCRPLIERKSVDLPEPEGPISATISPRRTSTDTPSSARRAPKLLDTLRIDSTAASGMDR